ncbi:MAG: 2-succinyl-5-enolpyruvyl-6-hydroxy-3-cyclohexene-1-carboxylic-acid synthase [Spirosomataceae bacterium]
MAVLQPILSIVSICAARGVTDAVICPGSRSAALTLAFARHPQITCRVVPDERAAAFIAMGIAQQQKRPVAIVCTSGSAGYNFAPAVTEAFFQEIPLLVFTADRPAEWIHQYDGQTIYQSNIFGKHIKEAIELGADYSHPDAVWFIERSMNHAINLAVSKPTGPVHLNVPIREPFYPQPDEKFVFSKPRTIEKSPIENSLPSFEWQKLMSEWEQFDKVLIVSGQYELNEELQTILYQLSEEFSVPVTGEILSNLTSSSFVRHTDIIFQQNHPDLIPDLLITFGKSVLSKNFKNFLKQNPPFAHWHIEISEHTIDPFQTLTRQLSVEPLYFFKKLLEDVDFQSFQNGDDDSKDESYFTNWQKAEAQALNKIEKFMANQTVFSELWVVYELTQHLPSNAYLHLANSMVVRYANLVGKRGNQVFANRGTSGIDGCTSTAVGAAIATEQLVILMTGDVAFFYDRNAFWHAHLPKNLKIILFNNQGGNIFRLIDGPGKLPELEPYFETRHTLTAQHLCQEFHLAYFTIHSQSDISKIDSFLTVSETAAILEVFTNPQTNDEIFKNFKEFLKA